MTLVPLSIAIPSKVAAISDGKAVLSIAAGKTFAGSLKRLSAADRIYFESLEKPSQQAATESKRAEQEAAYEIKRLGGSVKVDQQRPGKPVVRVDFMFLEEANVVVALGLENYASFTPYPA